MHSNIIVYSTSRLYPLYRNIPIFLVLRRSPIFPFFPILNGFRYRGNEKRKTEKRVLTDWRTTAAAVYSANPSNSVVVVVVDFFSFSHSLLEGIEIEREREMRRNFVTGWNGMRIKLILQSTHFYFLSYFRFYPFDFLELTPSRVLWVWVSLNSYRKKLK